MKTMIRLSVEEVAFIAGYLGETAAAAGYLTGVVGSQSAENFNGRITAAGHSLIARGLMQLGTSPGEVIVDDAARDLIQVVVSTNRSLRCEKLGGGENDVLTIFLNPERQVLHRIRSEVVAEICDVLGFDNITEQVAQFVGTSEAGNLTPLGTIDLAELEELRDRIVSLDRASVYALLATRIDTTAADELATVLKGDSVTWGSIMILDTADQAGTTQVVANEGILYASFAGQLWFFAIGSGDNQTKIYQGGKAVLGSLLQTLL